MTRSNGCPKHNTGTTLLGTAPQGLLPIKLFTGPSIASYVPKTARLQLVEEELVDRDNALRFSKIT